MPNLKQASSKANSKFNSKKPSAASLISGLGQSKASFDADSLLESMELAIGNFIERVINNIDKAVGKTGESILNTGNITNITAEKTDDAWQIKAPIYLDFQSKGVSGTKRNIPNSPYRFSGAYKTINLDAAKLFVRSRGIRFEGMSEDSTAYLIARSIYEKGIDAKNLWEGEVKQLQDEIGSDIANKIAESVGSKGTTKTIKI